MMMLNKTSKGHQSYYSSSSAGHEHHRKIFQCGPKECVQSFNRLATYRTDYNNRYDVITMCSCNSVTSMSTPAGQIGIIAGVCATISILVVITAVTAGLMCCRKDNMDNYISKRYLDQLSCVSCPALSASVSLFSTSSAENMSCSQESAFSPRQAEPDVPGVKC